MARAHVQGRRARSCKKSRCARTRRHGRDVDDACTYASHSAGPPFNDVDSKTGRRAKFIFEPGRDALHAKDWQTAHTGEAAG